MGHMPKIHSLIQSDSQQLRSNARNDIIFFFFIDLQYVYSQLNLHPETDRHYNFKIANGDMIGTYGPKALSYVLSDMPAKNQKAIVSTSKDVKRSAMRAARHLSIQKKFTSQQNHSNIANQPRQLALCKQQTQQPSRTTSNRRSKARTTKVTQTRKRKLSSTGIILDNPNDSIATCQPNTT